MEIEFISWSKRMVDRETVACTQAVDCCALEIVLLTYSLIPATNGQTENRQTDTEPYHIVHRCRAVKKVASAASLFNQMLKALK